MKLKDLKKQTLCEQQLDFIKLMDNRSLLYPEKVAVWLKVLLIRDEQGLIDHSELLNGVRLAMAGAMIESDKVDGIAADLWAAVSHCCDTEGTN